MIYSITLDKRVHTILGRFTIPTSRSRQPLVDTSIGTMWNNSQSTTLLEFLIVVPRE